MQTSFQVSLRAHVTAILNRGLDVTEYINTKKKSAASSGS
jgi:hypothetical protein